MTILARPKANTEPKEKLPELVVIGRDGLIVSSGPYSGLLLPHALDKAIEHIRITDLSTSRRNSR